MQTDPIDKFEGIEFTELAGRQLDAIRVRNPSLFAQLAGAIRANLRTWSPGDEDKMITRHVKSISDECHHNVYRLKYEIHGLSERRWRVFFMFLGLRRPPVRLVLAVVDFIDQQQCYDDPSQAHRVEIRRAVSEAVDRGETKKKR